LIYSTSDEEQVGSDSNSPYATLANTEHFYQSIVWCDLPVKLLFTSEANCSFGDTETIV
jgi:hypothetical protein